MTRGLSPLTADVLLLLAALIWGLGFVAQRLGAQHLDPLTFTGLRFTLGAIVLLPWVLPSISRGGFNRAHLVAGGVTGIVMAVAASFQQWGLAHTSAGNGAFITALYVVLVPLLGLLAGHRVRRVVWLAVALALVGLWFLSITHDFALERGDPIVLVCALGWAIHVVVVAKWSPSLNPIRYAFLQFAITGVSTLALGLMFGRPTLASIDAAKWAVLFGGVFPVGVAFTLQMIAQRTAPPTHTAIILSLESVFGMLAGAIFLSEVVTERKLLGASLMFAGMLLAQIRFGKPREEPLSP
ncbi:MAG: DMT family transporter [Phycisphaerae bacterium]|nr:DMT family transporter [Phycisphaerae bacterium]